MSSQLSTREISCHEIPLEVTGDNIRVVAAVIMLSVAKFVPPLLPRSLSRENVTRHDLERLDDFVWPSTGIIWPFWKRSAS